MTSWCWVAPPPVSCPPRLLTSLKPSVFGTSFDLFRFRHIFWPGSLPIYPQILSSSLLVFDIRLQPTFFGFRMTFCVFFSFWVFWFWISSFRHFRWINFLSVAPFLGAWRPKVKKLQLFSSVLVSRIGTWLGRFTHTFLRFLNFSFFGCLVRIKKGWEGRGGIACLGCYFGDILVIFALFCNVRYWFFRTHSIVACYGCILVKSATLKQ